MGLGRSGLWRDKMGHSGSGPHSGPLWRPCRRSSLDAKPVQSGVEVPPVVVKQVAGDEQERHLFVQAQAN